MSKKGKDGLGVLVTGVIVAGVIVGLNIAPKTSSADKKQLRVFGHCYSLI